MATKDLFEKFVNANFFSRIDSTHPIDLFVGLDEKGRKAIELRASFTPRKVSGTAAIEVSQYKKEAYNTIRFSLCDDEISGLFYTFCDDLTDQTKKLEDRSDGYTIIITRFFQWKKMFISSKKDLLTEPQIMGLIGEILYLRNELGKRIGFGRALRAWSGQELTHKDFSYDESWAEAKAISRSSQFVRISSLEQLDSEIVGELAVYAFEKMSTAYNGISLNRLIVDTRNLFFSDDDKDSFMAKVALQGYEYNNYYDDFVYEISSFRRYCVDADFPRLTPGNVPAAVGKATYDLLLIDLAGFEINR